VEELVNVLGLLSEFKLLVLLIQFQVYFSGLEVYAYVHFAVDFFGAFFFNYKHLFCKISLVLVEPRVV
jgi:hypothetical protein